MKRYLLAMSALTLAFAMPAVAQVNSPSEKLITAVREGQVNEVIDLVEGEASSAVNTRGFDGSTALTIALQAKRLDFAGYLLNHRADPSLANRAGDTPLTIAAQLGSMEAVEMLLTSGAAVDGGNRQGETPLIIAVHQRNTAIVRRLLAAKADPDKADHAAGMSAREYAKRDNRVPALIQMIEAAKPSSGR